MNPLVQLLDALSRGGFQLTAEGEDLVVEPGSKLTSKLEDDIRRLKPDLLELLRLHGPRLLDLFSHPPTWPPACGRSGSTAADWWRIVGDPVRLRDGREGKLWAVSYDTRSGRLRLRVVFPHGWALLDPEDVLRFSSAPQSEAKPA